MRPVAPNPGQFRGQGSRPRRRPFPAVGSAGSTAQIVLLPVILQKKPSNLREINPRSKFLSQKILQKNPQFFSKSTHSPTVLVEENL